MKLETLLQLLAPGHQVRVDGMHELETGQDAGYEWLLPEGYPERTVKRLRFFIEPDDPGIRLMTEAETLPVPGDRGCWLDELLEVLELEEEAEVHVSRGQEKLGHASPLRIGAVLSNSVLESPVAGIAASLDREWDLVLDVEIS